MILWYYDKCQNLFIYFLNPYPLINLFSKTSFGALYYHQIVFSLLLVPHGEYEKYTVKKIQFYPPFHKNKSHLI